MAMEQKTVPTIEDAILAMVATDPDRARELNGVGFNKLDSDFGHSLASSAKQYGTLTEKQLNAAIRMLTKYRAQLQNVWGINLEDAVAESRRRLTLKSPVLVEDDGSLPGNVRVEHDQILITVPRSPDGKPFWHIVDAIKQRYTQRAWSPKSKDWTVPLNITSANITLALMREFGIPGATNELEALVLRADHNVVESRALSGDLQVEDLGGELLPFQRAGVAYAIRQRRVIIGDEMGLGKTVQGLAWLQGLKAYPALVVVPAIVKLNWLREAVKWLPGKRIRVLNGGKCSGAPLSGADVWIINYDILVKWEASLAATEFQAVILDEFHYIKNPQAKRTKAALSLLKSVENRLMLSGTPVLNRPVELVEPLKGLGVMKQLFGSPFKFKMRYCFSGENSWGREYNGARHLEELNRILRTECYVRREKREVMPELPPVRHSVVPVEIADRPGYDRIAKDLRAYFQELVKKDREFERFLQTLPVERREEERARYITIRTAKASRARHLAMINACKRAVADRKLASVRAWVEDFLESSEGQKIILLAHHRDVEDDLAEVFNAPLIRGGMGKERQAAEDRFQTDPECRVLVLSEDIAVGLNLTAATHVAFVEFPWRPGDIDQSIGRAYGRISDAHGVNAYYLVGERTIDEMICTLLDSKRSVVATVASGGVTKDQQHSIMDDLIELLGREDDRGEDAPE